MSSVLRHLIHQLRVFRRLNRLERRMSATEDALVELDAATTAVADRIDALIADLGEVDTATAAKIAVETAKLRGLAADPENPVPAPENPEV